MKFLCECGYAFVDQTDGLPFKAHSCPDESREALFNAIDRLIESPAPSGLLQWHQMTAEIVHPMGRRDLYQCPECGRIYVGNDDRLHCFKPEFEDTPKDLFRSNTC